MARRGASAQEELGARDDEIQSGNKAWLRRRLHMAIVRAHLRRRSADEEGE